MVEENCASLITVTKLGPYEIIIFSQILFKFFLYIEFFFFFRILFIALIIKKVV